MKCSCWTLGSNLISITVELVSVKLSSNSNVPSENEHEHQYNPSARPRFTSPEGLIGFTTAVAAFTVVTSTSMLYQENDDICLGGWRSIFYDHLWLLAGHIGYKCPSVFTAGTDLES